MISDILGFGFLPPSVHAMPEARRGYSTGPVTEHGAAALTVGSSTISPDTTLHGTVPVLLRIDT